MTDSIHTRKAEHIEITLNEKVTGNTISTGLERVHFIHNALPEINFNDISIKSEFLGQSRPTPFVISSMTGGAQFAETINRNLAMAAAEKGWVLALGSMRALIESEEHRSSFQVRQYAPNVPIIANLGAVQLNYGFGTEQCKQIIEMTDADALVLHLNTIQEVIQPNGDLNFGNLLEKIEKLTKELGVPVGVKEVGWGIDGLTAKKLCDIGISFIDVAGAGGTSWSQVEKFRSKEPIKRAAAETFSDWGNPTVDCVVSVRESIGEHSIVASGGMYTGLDAAKTIALGANMVGFGRSILKEATQSVEAVMDVMETKELELRMAMFGIGAATIEQLQSTERVQYRKR